MNKIALELIKIANDLDDLEQYIYAEQIEDIAKDLISKADTAPAPSKQPQIQSEPIKQLVKEVDADKEFKKDKKDKSNKKTKIKGLVEGQDFILDKHSEE